MLNEQELKVVRNYKEWGFGAYLAWAWLEYPHITKEIKAGKYPDAKRLMFINERMNQKRIAFDCTYLHLLPTEQVNPLQVEQEAWKLLSPLVKEQVDTFGGYVTTYDPKIAQREPLLTQVSNGWNLLQDWNTLSNCYKMKLEEVWDEVESHEQSVRGLIKKLSEC